MTRLLVIGIDGGNWQILDSAIDGGYMPFLKRLKTENLHGNLESTIPAITPTAWATFQTGVSPAANNIFSFSYLDRETREEHFSTTLTMQKTVWEIISDAGLKVSVVNLPMTYPPRDINGYVITGVNTPSEDSEFTSPQGFKEEILQDFPDYRIFTLDNMRRDFSGYYIEKITNQLTEIIKERLAVAKFVLRKQNHDVFMLHFQATDIIQHAMWPLIDSCSEMFDKCKQEFIFKTFYGCLDNCIKELFEEFGSNSPFKFIIASDHGFENHKCRFNLSNWLEVNGYLKTAQPVTNWKKKISRGLKIGRFLKTFIKEETVNKIETAVKVRNEPIDKSKTKACAIGRGSEGFLYCFDMKEKDKAALISKLTKVKIPETDELLIEKIVSCHDLYKCDIPSNFPDYIIIPRPNYTITGNLVKGEGLFSDVLPKDDLHLGKHSPQGVFILGGVGQSGQMDRSIYDIAPTILASLGLDVPEYFVGTPISSETYNKGHVEPISIKEPQSNEDDDQKIRDRLSNLGYM